jgi:hypothetical protein
MNYNCFIYRDTIIFTEVLLHITALANDAVEAPEIFLDEPVVQKLQACTPAVDAYNARFTGNEFYGRRKMFPENGQVYIEVIGRGKNNIGFCILYDSLYFKQGETDLFQVEVGYRNGLVCYGIEWLTVIQHQQVNRKSIRINMVAQCGYKFFGTAALQCGC